MHSLLGCRFVLGVLAAVAAFAPVAQADEHGPRWVQRHYGSTDGLPVSSANSARIDADGFLWLATHDGLARFDGQRFQVYESMRFPAMSGNRVLSLHLDAQQRMYAQTAHGDWLAVRSDRIESALPQDASRADVRFVDPASLCVTTPRVLHCPDGGGAFPARLRFPPGADAASAMRSATGTVWMTTPASEVWLHRDEAWRMVREATGERVITGLVDEDDVFWGGMSKHLLRIDASGTQRRWDADGDPEDIAQVHAGPPGEVWIGAINGVFVVRGDQVQRAFVADDADSRLSYFSWLAPDAARWVAHGGRLWRFAEGQAMRPDAAPVLVSDGHIHDLLFGEDDGVWVLTLHGGIHRLNRTRVDVLDSTAGLFDGNIYGVARDRDDTMWLGSLGNGLLSVDRKGAVTRHGRESGLPGDHPWLVQAAPDGSVYVATYAPGLWQRRPGEAQFGPVALPEALRSEQILALMFDDTQRLWLGSTAGAWRRDGDRWVRQWPAEPRRQRVNALAFSDDAVWFGGMDGVVRVDARGAQAVATQLLAQTSVRDLFLSRGGALWISTDGRGLVRVAPEDPSGARAVQLGRRQGLPSNSPHTVREDADGHLWVNSNQGIFRIARGNLEAFLHGTVHRLSPLALGLSDGLSELEGNGGVQPAAAFDAAGRLWFPSQRGIVRFDPLAMPLRETPPRAVIDGLESEGHALPLDGKRSLPVGVRSLLIRYGAADLHAGADVRFRYRLLPQDSVWTDALNGCAAAFSGLPPDDYRFELLAGNSDGIWAEAPATFAFRVPPRWFETGVLRALLLAAMSALVLLGMRLRLRQLRLRAAELDRQVGERTEELRTEKGRVETALLELSGAHTQLAQTHAQIEHSNLKLAEQAQRLEALDQFRSRLLADVSHELRTPVMLVSMPLKELEAQLRVLDDVQRGKLQMSIKQLDRLAGLIEQLVGLVQVESGQTPLRASRLDLLPLLHDIAAGYRPMAERAGVELQVRSDVSDCHLFADRQHLTTIVGNLVDNAIKHTPAGSAVGMVAWVEHEHAIVEVVDQGPGFDASVAARLFERFFRAPGPPRLGREGLGIGLALARELVELHGGRIAASSTPGAGARFRVALPLGAAHVALDDLALDPAPAAPPAPAPPAERGEGRLLLVEDHPDLAAYLAERLGEHVPVTCVGSAEQAAGVLADDPGIRLVVSDVVLPGASGLELCRQLASPSEPRRRPVILISAKAADSDRAAGLAAGAMDYLAKPFNFETLLHAMARAWPEAAPRLVARLLEPGAQDPLLGIALNALADPAFAIAGWAAQAHLSERQLRRRVNELTGQSPQTWLREQRLLRVRHLLRSGACKTLAEAGARCGLDNPAYLYRSYRARFGEQ